MNKKVLLVSGLMVLLGGFFVYEKFVIVPQNQTPIINDNQTQVSGNNPPSQTAINNQQPTTITPPPKKTPPPASTGLKSGTYTGDTVQSMYGPVQAQVVISSGKIVDINFLQYPSDRSTSLRKSQMAMPVIKQEVIQSQSANVNTVSGATETSYSFMQSISSALGQAS